jgi:hypothetical protein
MYQAILSSIEKQKVHHYPHRHLYQWHKQSCTISISTNYLLGTKITTAIVYVPSYFIITTRSRKYIIIAIAIYINGINRGCTISISTNYLFGAKVAITIVYVPSYFIS